MKSYSYHTFILPFIWEHSTNATDSQRGDRPELQYAAMLAKFRSCDDWAEMYVFKGGLVQVSGGINNEAFYNEYKYFHPHVCESIYGYLNDDNLRCDNIVTSFTLMPGGKKLQGSYVIRKKNDYGTSEYKLQVESIDVKIYNTGVGLYILRCTNKKDEQGQDNLDTVKAINDYGRRITKPTLKNYVCASSLTLDIKGLGCFEENWNDLDKKISSGMIDSLSYISKTVTGPFESLGIDAGDITLGIDDRMFVMSWTSDADKTRKFIVRDKGEYILFSDEQISKDIYEMAAVDLAGKCSCQSMDMRRDLLDKYVYPRWIDWETIYTITAQGFIALSSANDEGDTAFLIDYFNTQYCQLCCLCLAQRTTLINFSRKAEHISKGIERKSNTLKKTDRQEMMDLQERYIAFLTQIDASEASPEEQGIEIYNSLREALNVESEKKSLQEQLTGLNELANSSQDFNFNKWAAVIAIMALCLAAADLIGNNYEYGSIKSYWTVIMVAMTFMAGLAAWFFNRRRK